MYIVYVKPKPLGRGTRNWLQKTFRVERTKDLSKFDHQTGVKLKKKTDHHRSDFFETWRTHFL